MSSPPYSGMSRSFISSFKSFCCNKLAYLSIFKSLAGEEALAWVWILVRADTSRSTALLFRSASVMRILSWSNMAGGGVMDRCLFDYCGTTCNTMLSFSRTTVSSYFGGSIT